MDRTWNVLDVGSVWMKEFAAALQTTEAVNAWTPRFGLAGALSKRVERESIQNPPLHLYTIPLQRGYARTPIRQLAPYEYRFLEYLLHQTPDPKNSPLICSSPYYAPLAELWPGPVVYYSTDLTIAYPNVKRAQVLELDRTLCKRADFVCPNSRRIADYLQRDAFCSPEKITIIPNATRASNISPEPQRRPGRLPADLQHLTRPIVGVLGDLSANTDWPLLLSAIQQTPDFAWVFVGPARPMKDKTQSAARDAVMKLSTFVGLKPYHLLQEYARAFAVAVLPYRRCEPTYSGSSTRFYEHLAAGRPMIGTHGFAELEEKGNLIRLVDSEQELASRLEELKQSDFVDGHETERWRASQKGTWEARAETLRRLFSAPAGRKTGARELQPSAPICDTVPACS